MSDLYWLTDEQMERLRPFFPKSHGRPRVDDRRVLSGIIFVNRNGLRWRDAPKDYGPAKTLYNRWKRWGEAGVFVRMSGLVKRLDIFNVRSDVSEGDPRDIVNVAGKIGTIVVDRCRLTGVKGRQAGAHGDCMQVFDGASVDLLMIRRSTLQSAYQAVMAKLRDDGTGVKRIIVQDTNIRDFAEACVQQSVALMFAACQSRQASIEFRNAWLDWPKGSHYGIATIGKVKRIGTFNLGHPPDGDFCPA